MTSLSLEHIFKSFRSGTEMLNVLEDITISFTAPLSVSVTGESGSGKSTLLHIIAGIDNPSAGSVSVNQRRIDNLNEQEAAAVRGNTIGLVFQSHYLMKDFSALENVMFPGYLTGLARKEAKEKAAELLYEVGLEKRLSHLPAQLSGGEQQRVALARSFINDPAIILADEPTGNLDERRSMMVQELLLNMSDKRGKLLLYVTHDPVFAKRAEKVYVLHNGTLNDG